MKTKRKNRRMASATDDQELDSNDHLSRQRNQSNSALASRDDSPLRDTATFWDQQYHSNPRNTVEQPSSSSKRHALTQSPLPVAMSQWEQLLNLRLQHHHVQEGHLLSQSAMPLGLPHLFGYQVPGVNAPDVPRPFIPIGTIDGSWHFPMVGGGGTSLKNHPQVSNPGYQFVCPYPCFPGPWEASSRWQLCTPCTYTVPGPYGYVCSQPPYMPGSATSLLQSFQRGIIRTPEKLSQKHQQLWDAQSAENVQLWSVLGQLQSEITGYKSRIMKLEAEIPPVKQAVEDPSAHVVGSAVSRKALKRGRPRKLAAPVDAPPSLDKPQLQAQAKKSEPCKVQLEARAHIFEEVVLNKVEKKEEQSNAIVTADQENKKNSKMLPNSNVNMGVDGGELIMPPFHFQVHQQMLGVQMCAAGLDSSLDMKNNDYMVGDPSIASEIFSKEANNIDNKGAVATYLGEMNKRNLAWPSIISSKDSGKNVLNMTSSEAFYNNGSVIQQVGNFIPGWSLMNGGDASYEFVDGLVALSKDDNEEEMRDDACERGQGPPHISNQ